MCFQVVAIGEFFQSPLSNFFILMAKPICMAKKEQKRRKKERERELLLVTVALQSTRGTISNILCNSDSVMNLVVKSVYWLQFYAAILCNINKFIFTDRLNRRSRSSEIIRLKKK